MSNSKKKKKLARELQEFGGGAVSYTACLRLLEDRGMEEAKKQVAEWTAAGDKELAAIQTGHVP